MTLDQDQEIVMCVMLRVYRKGVEGSMSEEEPAVQSAGKACLAEGKASVKTRGQLFRGKSSQELAWA